MKTEQEIMDVIDMLEAFIDDEPAGLIASAIAALRWCLK